MYIQIYANNILISRVYILVNIQLYKIVYEIRICIYYVNIIFYTLIY